MVHLLCQSYGLQLPWQCALQAAHPLLQQCACRQHSLQTRQTMHLQPYPSNQYSQHPHHQIVDVPACCNTIYCSSRCTTYNSTSQASTHAGGGGQAAALIYKCRKLRTLVCMPYEARNHACSCPVLLQHQEGTHERRNVSTNVYKHLGAGRILQTR
jgi:hypothetical protein